MEDQIHTAEEQMGEGNSSFCTVQPLRDLQSNWSVDLAKNLEDYLLKICSGEISGNEGRNVNFAEGLFPFLFSTFWLFIPIPGFYVF